MCVWVTPPPGGASNLQPVQHHAGVCVRECCLLVLGTVTSTPQWIRQPTVFITYGAVSCLLRIGRQVSVCVSVTPGLATRGWGARPFIFCSPVHTGLPGCARREAPVLIIIRTHRRSRWCGPDGPTTRALHLQPPTTPALHPPTPPPPLLPQRSAASYVHSQVPWWLAMPGASL